MIARFLCVLVCVAVGGLAPATASAHRQPYPYDTTKWQHYHTGPQTFYNSITYQRHRDETRDAQLDWNNNGYRSIPSTSVHDGSRVHAVGAFYSGNFCGRALPDSWHINHGHLDMNISCDLGYSDYMLQAYACQELGHLMGQAHAPGDCMGFTYYSDWTATISSHTQSDTRYYYTNAH